MMRSLLNQERLKNMKNTLANFGNFSPSTLNLSIVLKDARLPLDFLMDSPGSLMKIPSSIR